MKILGQAWVYRVGNSVVRVENAFTWAGWCQERLRVNDETVSEAFGWFGARRDFHEDWLTATGEGLLSVRLTSQLMGIRCDVTLDGAPIEPEANETVVWAGPRRSWPGAGEWAPLGDTATRTINPLRSRR